jgi:hypothetical protein
MTMVPITRYQNLKKVSLTYSAGQTMSSNIVFIAILIETFAEIVKSYNYKSPFK